MAHRIKPSSQHDKTGPAFYWASFVLACLGLLDAVYLLIYKLTGNNAMCIGNGGCHDVNFSSYSEIGKIPVSVFGIAAFLFIGGLLLLEPRVKLIKDNGPLVIFGASLTGVAFVAYLTWLEVNVIHAICPFCVATAVIITLIFILAIIRLVKQTGN
jgi:uncharacterized membrane protein